MTWLLDTNVLLALSSAQHQDHEAAQRWFAGVQRFASCPITQGGLLRNFARMQDRASLREAWNFLEAVLDHDAHEFWADVIDYRSSVPHVQLQGAAQVTDAYLAALARHYGGRVATFGRAFAALHSDVVTNIGAT
ncbi:MAG: TA system VapC family ribonuclease toxin [Myxococcaceae bacterium]